MKALMRRYNMFHFMWLNHRRKVKSKILFLTLSYAWMIDTLSLMNIPIYIILSMTWFLAAPERSSLGFDLYWISDCRFTHFFTKRAIYLIKISAIHFIGTFSSREIVILCYWAEIHFILRETIFHSRFTSVIERHMILLDYLWYIVHILFVFMRYLYIIDLY